MLCCGDELPFGVHDGHSPMGEASDFAVVFGLGEHGLSIVAHRFL
jgi:hypothetical protein